MAAWTILNTPLPIVSQHVPPSDNAENLLCGEACAASVIGYCWGTDNMPVAAEIGRAINATGKLSTPDMLRSYLNNKWGIGTTRFTNSTQETDFTYNIWHYLVRGKLLLLTQKFSTTVGETHWRLVVGMNSDDLIFLMEPWNGSIVYQSYDNCWNLFNSAGASRCLIGVDHGIYSP